ncbi:MAG: DUF2244 domain-containing protein [Pseudomonadota bacterium]
MPYSWSHDDTTIAGAGGLSPVWRLVVWPHRSLSPEGFVLFIAITSGMLLLPLITFIGSVALWYVLPFMAAAVAMVWYGIRRNSRDGEMREDLSLTCDEIAITRQNPKGPDQCWRANPYWVRVAMHESGGPVENYITLSGAGREVELGAFLSPDERERLYGDLLDRLAELRGSEGTPPQPAQ